MRIARNLAIDAARRRDAASRGLRFWPRNEVAPDPADLVIRDETDRLNAGIRDGRLLVFVQVHSAKAQDLEANPHYALHAHQDPERPHEFMVRGQARLVTDALRADAAANWFFTVSDDYPLYELLIEHALLGERDSASDWPPAYRSWRSA